MSGVKLLFVLWCYVYRITRKLVSRLQNNKEIVVGNIKQCSIEIRMSLPVVVMGGFQFLTKLDLATTN